MEFDFEGQFLNFINRDGKLKYIRLKVLSEDIQVKLPKVMRVAGGLSLQPGELIRVTDIGKLDRSADTFKLKATQVISLTDRATEKTPEILPDQVFSVTRSSQNKSQISPKISPKIKVLVCQKSGCVKRGSRGLCERLGQTLCDRGLEQYVSIKRTGCLKRCSSAPNLVITPGNHRYTAVRPQMLPQIADAIAQSLARLRLLVQCDLPNLSSLKFNGVYFKVGSFTEQRFQPTKVSADLGVQFFSL